MRRALDGWTAGRLDSKPAVKPSSRQAVKLRAAALALAIALIASAARAQAPYLTWRTLTTRYSNFQHDGPNCLRRVLCGLRGG